MDIFLEMKLTKSPSTEDEDFSDAMGYTITGAIKPWVAPLKKRY